MYCSTPLLVSNITKTNILNIKNRTPTLLKKDDTRVAYPSNFYGLVRLVYTLFALICPRDWSEHTF